MGLFIYDQKTGTIKPFGPYFNAKEIVVTPEKVYIATASGVQVLKTEDLVNMKPAEFKKIPFNKTGRCRSIALLNDTLFAAYSDGVYIYTRDTIQRLIYKNAPVYSSEVQTLFNKVLIGTYSQGILAFEGAP